MRPERAAYEDLISSLADGTPVDWSALEADAPNENERRRYRNLRLVARVAELHRTITFDDDALEPVPVVETGETPTMWGDLKLVERVGSGAYGDLYRARDPQLDRDVALKLLRGDRASSTDRLLSEARTLARVKHRNVVTVHGADVCDGRAGLWMELIDGQTLASLAGARGELGAAEATAIGRDLCSALAAVHAAGIVHGDVKAQNVMREAGGRIVLMDFGSGRRQGAASPVTGTPMYLAPEVLAGAPATVQSDLYSLGVLLFHLLTGAYPYAAADLESLRFAHAEGSRAYLRDLRPDLPDSLVDAIERAIEPDPALRFRTAGTMERALATAQGSSTRWWKMLTAAAVAAAAITVVVLAWPRRPVDSTIRTIAVLPFALSGEEGAYLVEGVSRDLIRELQRFDIQVRTATLAAYRDAGSSFDTRLGADAIVEGTARRALSGTDLALSVRRAGAGPFWRQNYSIPNNRLPSVGQTLAEDVAHAVGALRTSGTPSLYQADARAYELYHRGRERAEQRTQSDLMLSLKYFAEAAKLDPRYAAPWAGMADTYLALGVPPHGDLRPREARVKAKQAAEKALEIDRNSVEAETSLGIGAYLYDWEWAESEARFKKAIALNPQYARAHWQYSMLLTDMGRFEEARLHISEAQRIDPTSVLFQRDLAWIEFCAAQYGSAIAQLRETLALDPKYPAAYTLLARSLAANGQPYEGLAELEHARDGISRASYLAFRGYIEAVARDPRARQSLDELTALAREEYVTPYYPALIHTAMGDREQAIAALDRALSEQDSTLGSVNVDPRFDPLRSDPRFQKIIEAMKFPRPKR